MFDSGKQGRLQGAGKQSLLAVDDDFIRNNGEIETTMTTTETENAICILGS
jgi:hypothetical protein